MDTNATHDVIRALGMAVTWMRYPDFCAALRIEDDDYARDKYAELKVLARAMRPFSNAQLHWITEAFAASKHGASA